MEKFVCKVCGREVEHNKHKGNKGGLCSSCITLRSRLKRKKKEIDYLGGECSICGYNKSMSALEFHHIDDTTKEFNISNSYNMSWECIKNELDKCILLCANCHRELHDKLKERPVELSYFPNTNYIKKNNIKQSNYNKFKDIILNCKVDFSSITWSKELSTLLEYSPICTYLWVKKNMPMFYDTKCNKYDSFTDNELELIKEEISNNGSILSFSREYGISKCDIDRILYSENNSYKRCNSCNIEMFDIAGNVLEKSFSTKSDAVDYIVANFVGRCNKPITRISADGSLRKCLTGKSATSYNHVWKYKN